MQILVCGVSVVGRYFVKYFSKQGHDVFVIDKSQHVINKISKLFDVQTFVGDASLPTRLPELNINNIDIVVATTGDDNVNLIICKLSSILFPNSKRIARINDIDSGCDNILYHKMSVDITFFPEREVADFLYNAIFNSITIPKCKFQLVIHYGDKARNDGFNQLGKIIDGDFFLTSDKSDNSDDVIISICEKKDLSLDENVVIIGGGKISTILAKNLLSINCSVSIIEQNYGIAKELANVLPDAEVIYGSHVEEDILNEAGIDENSIVVTTTNNDQTNLIALLLAHNIGCRNTIGVINTHTSYLNIAKSIGISKMKIIGDIVSSSTINFFSDSHIKKLSKIASFHIFLVKIISDSILKKVEDGDDVKLVIIRGEKFFFYEDAELNLHDEVVVLTNKVDFIKEFMQ